MIYLRGSGLIVNKLFNRITYWTLGGFFRRLGGFLAFLLIAIIISIFLNNKGYKLPQWLTIKAATIENWSSNQVKVQTCLDSECSWSSNYSGNHTFTSSDLTYPIQALEWRVKASDGISRENTYTFSFGYLSTPDSLAVDTYFMRRNASSDKENIQCTQSLRSDGYYVYNCTLMTSSDYTSDEWLYIQIHFRLGYITKLETFITGFDERKGTNAVITESTSDIINNNNDNTEQIINNNNQNTQDIINSNKVCNIYSINNKIPIAIDNTRISNSSTGAMSSSNGYFVSNYYSLDSAILTKVYKSNYLSCFYGSSYDFISCIQAGNSVPIGEISIPENAKFIRFTIQKSNDVDIFTLKSCKNGNQSVTDALTDDTPPDVSELDNMVGYLPPGPVDSILTLPLNLLNTINTNLGGTCSEISIPLPYIKSSLKIPCLNSIYDKITGLSVALNTIGGILSAVIMYNYLLFLYSWVDDITSLTHNRPRLFGAKSDADNWARAE